MADLIWWQTWLDDESEQFNQTQKNTYFLFNPSFKYAIDSETYPLSKEFKTTSDKETASANSSPPYQTKIKMDSH